MVFINLENLSKNNSKFVDYIEDKYDTEKINKRYLTLMKEFLTSYAFE